MSFFSAFTLFVSKFLSCKRCILSRSIQKQHFPDLPADACYIFGAYQSCKMPEIKLDPALTSAHSLTYAQSPRHDATIATTTPSEPLSSPQLYRTPTPYSTMQLTCIPPSSSSCNIANANAILNNARSEFHHPHHLAILSGFKKV